MRTTFVALMVLVAAGCGCKHDGSNTTGTEVVARLDDHHTLAPPVTVGNLTVWPVLTDRPLDLGEFLTLEEAIARGAAEVREIGSANNAQQVAEVQFGNEAPENDAADSAGAGSPVEPPASTLVPGQEEGQVLLEEPVAEEGVPAEGSRDVTRSRCGHGEEPEAQTLSEALTDIRGAEVNTLVIENKGDLPILVCAGTVVKGGNQDRQIGQDFVLKANSTTPVDAFCVEPGRWQSDRLGQQTEGKFQVLDGMATAKVRSKGQYEKNQDAVWEEVRNVRTVFNTTVEPAEDEPPFTLVGQPLDNSTQARNVAIISSGSSSYAVAFEANAAASAEDLKRSEDAVKRHFADHEGAVGFAYAINGDPVAVRTFAHPRLLRKQLDDFVRGMATEALLAKSDAAAKEARAEDVVTLVKEISAANEAFEDTAGLNRNGVRRNDAGFNGNCYVTDAEGNPAALTRDWTKK